MLNNEYIKTLGDIFKADEKKLWLVGGCVRDHFRGEIASDIDLATDATPTEAIEIYEKHDLRYIETGLDHGTITVVLEGIPYEITTLRIDKECDGRHAEVEYTTDIVKDLSRRDFTMNAIAIDVHSGEVIDPYYGRYDIEDNLIKFVGKVEDRIEEDALRILRWFRFAARYEVNIFDVYDYSAAFGYHAHLLESISKERVWSEIAKFLKYVKNYDLLWELQFTIGKSIGLNSEPKGIWIHGRGITPAMLLGITFPKEAKSLQKDWKLSNQEIKEMNFALERINRYTFKDAKYDLMVNKFPIEWINIFLFDGDINAWEPETQFEIDGNDLLSLGFSGIGLGNELKRLKSLWVESDYSLTKKELLNVE